MATITQTTEARLTLQERHDVKTEILYTKEPQDGRPVTIEDIHSYNADFREIRSLVVKDVRPAVSEYTLEKHGFQYVEHQVSQDHFIDEATIKSVHYPEVEAFIAKT